MCSMISHRLDLCMNLIDTTTGFKIKESIVEFSFDKAGIPNPINREEGVYLMINSGRENFLMQIKVRGYEPRSYYVDYEKLDSNLPMVEIFLIPSESISGGVSLCTLKGKIPNLQKVSLVIKSDIVARTDAYDERKRILTVFEKGYRLNMEGSPYGLVNEREKTFEFIEVISQPDSDKVKLKQALTGEFLRNAPICRIIFGYVEPDGSYLIRVRDDRSKLNGLIRYDTDSEIRFEEVDFHEVEVHQD